jgi:hypothetical protein
LRLRVFSFAGRPCPFPDVFFMMISFMNLNCYYIRLVLSYLESIDSVCVRKAFS